MIKHGPNSSSDCIAEVCPDEGCPAKVCLVEVYSSAVQTSAGQAFGADFTMHYERAPPPPEARRGAAPPPLRCALEGFATLRRRWRLAEWYLWRTDRKGDLWEQSATDSK